MSYPTNIATGIIVLAAGGSSRLGRPKQLLAFKGSTLLQHVVHEAFKANSGPVLVVLGANRNAITGLEFDPPPSYAFNENWEDGLSSSIRSGLLALMEQCPDLENVILTVSDQPYLNAALFRKLIEQHQNTGKNIIASSYAQTLGTPALFNRIYFNELLGLGDKEGAKKLLNLHNTDVETVIFEKGDIDIDTEADYKNLLKQQNL